MGKTGKAQIKEIIDEFSSLPEKDRKELYPKFEATMAELLNDPYDINSVMENTSDTALFPFGDKLGTESRNQVKNYGNSTYDAINYLEKRHPDLEFGHKNGEIYGRKPGTDAWSPLDPSPANYADWKKWATGENLGEAFQDVGDASYDTATGIPKTLGALYLAAQTGGFAIPAMMGTNFITGTGNDALRQKIGEWKGINSQVDPYQALGAGVTDALSTPIFGSGLSGSMVKVVPKKAMAQYRNFVARSNGVTVKDLINLSDAQVLDQAGKSLRYGGLLPKLMSMSATATKGLTGAMTGRSSEAIQNVVDSPWDWSRMRPSILADNTSELVPRARNVQTLVENAAPTAKKQAQAALDAALPSDAPVYIGEVRNHLRTRAKEAKDYLQEAIDSGMDKSTIKERRKVLELIMALRKDTKAISPNKTITGKQYVDQIQDLGGKIRWSEANQKPGIAGRVNAVRKEVKEKLSHVAEDQYKDLPAARQAYAQGLVDEDRLTKAASDTTGMRKLVGGEDKLGKTVEFHEALGRSMTDAEYAKYIKDRDFLRTNMQWFKETPIDLPVGTMKAAGAMGAVGLKGTAASNVAETVATGLLRPAKLAGKIMRTGAPVLSTYTNADSDQLMNYLGLPQFATKPVTMNPEEQENQKGIFEILQKLGGRTNE